MSDVRIIKKYPNRRLYDTELSRYITLNDVRQLVIDGVDLRVVDAKTDEDLTRPVLLQIIMESEEGGAQPIFSTQSLTEIIRYYGDAVEGATSEFLQRSLAMFFEQQKLFQQRLRETVVTNPLAAVTELTERNLALWSDMQRRFLEAASAPLSAPRSRSRREREGEPRPDPERTATRHPADGQRPREVKESG